MHDTMKRFEFTDHTADIGIIAYGSALDEVFTNAALGMFSLIGDPDAVTHQISREIKLDAYDREELLIAWLNHLLYLFDADNLIFSRFDFFQINNYELAATAYGEAVNPLRHNLKTHIKAATYHLLEIVENNGFQAQVIFDI